jgi:hypothetical protein
MRPDPMRGAPQRKPPARSVSTGSSGWSLWVGAAAAAAVGGVGGLLWYRTPAPSADSSIAPPSHVAPAPAPAPRPAAVDLRGAWGTATGSSPMSPVQAAAGRASTSTPAVALPPPAAMADSVRLAQSVASDPMPGFRVYPGRNRGDFARLGLHPGDLITAVNGAPVTGQAGESVLDLIKGGASSITVFRAGREQEIQLPPAN